MKDERRWPRPTLVIFGRIIVSEQQMCFYMFFRCAEQVLLAAWLVSYSVVLFGNNKQTVLKRKEDHTPLVLDFMKNRDCL